MRPRPRDRHRDDGRELARRALRSANLRLVDVDGGWSCQEAPLAGPGRSPYSEGTFNLANPFVMSCPEQTSMHPNALFLRSTSRRSLLTTGVISAYIPAAMPTRA